MDEATRMLIDQQREAHQQAIFTVESQKKGKEAIGKGLA